MTLRNSGVKRAYKHRWGNAALKGRELSAHSLTSILTDNPIIQTFRRLKIKALPGLLRETVVRRANSSLRKG